MAVKIPAGKHMMDLVAVDWFKEKKRMDHVARRKGCAAQVRVKLHFFASLFLTFKLLELSCLYNCALSMPLNMEPTHKDKLTNFPTALIAI